MSNALQLQQIAGLELDKQQRGAWLGDEIAKCVEVAIAAKIGNRQYVAVDTDEAGFMRLIRPLQQEVKHQKLWATHLPPELGGQGYGQVKLGLMHEIEGATVWAPTVFGNQAPDSGNSEVLAHFGYTADNVASRARQLLATRE